MMTCKIIRKILPSTLPMAAILLIGTTLSTEVLAAKKNAEVSTAAVSDSTASSRIKELKYDESTVYVIRTKYGYQTNIVFDPKEEIQTMSVGDRSLWQLIPEGNRLYIRPMTENLSTNMTLITNKRSYEFDLKSVDNKSEGNAYVVRFVYPDKLDAPVFNNTASVQTGSMMEAPAVQSAPPVPVVVTDNNTLKLPEVTKPKNVEVPKAADTNNYQYTYSGLDSLAPLQVYDDGHSTFIKYKSFPKSIPSAVVIESNGQESPVPSLVKGSTLVIDVVAGEVALRNAGGEVRIYNELINPR